MPSSLARKWVAVVLFLFKAAEVGRLQILQSVLPGGGYVGWLMAVDSDFRSWAVV